MNGLTPAAKTICYSEIAIPLSVWRQLFAISVLAIYLGPNLLLPGLAMLVVAAAALFMSGLLYFGNWRNDTPTTVSTSSEIPAMESAHRELVRRPLSWCVLMLVNVIFICWLYTS